MATRYKIKTEENNHVHFNGAPHTGIDYTLCGLNCDSLGDPGIGIEPKKFTNQKVNCPTCIAIVSYCHTIKKTEFKPPTIQ